MLSPEWMVALPLWILGLPLIVGLFAFIRPGRIGGFIPPDRRSQRSNLISEPIISADRSVHLKG